MPSVYETRLKGLKANSNLMGTELFLFLYIKVVLAVLKKPSPPFPHIRLCSVRALSYRLIPKKVNPETILVPSLFPNVPPYLAFYSDQKRPGDTNQQYATSMRMRMRMREYCYKEQREKIKTDWYIHFQKIMIGWVFGQNT
uniref:Uncharacterized protein n=1 Tax=Glossina brevipalpis TaxID=37001 RepID=A0A1A9WTP9_9MUSC